MENKEITLVTDKIPAHVKASAGLGNEEVSTEHLQTPRVKLLQTMNNEVDENHSEYINGVKPGDFINNVTKENYGTTMFVLNVRFTEDFVVWKKREFGGGLIGTFKNLQDATEFMSAQKMDPEQHDVIQTHSHLLIEKNPETGNLGIPFIMDFSSSKLRVSRSWNSQIQTKGGDRFSVLWKLESVKKANRAGQQFYNLDVTELGWAQDDDYNIAKELYTRTLSS
jgi:hypothetical protein